MALSPVTGLYQLTLPYSGASFDNIPYKFFIKMDSATAEVRFPGFGAVSDEVQYEHPYSLGGGNRVFTLPTSGGTVVRPPVYFDGISRHGTFLRASDTCRVTVRVNMGPGTRETDPFFPATDTVFLVWRDQRWARAQIANQGVFDLRVRLTRASSTDSIWTGNFRVKGKAHFGLMYLYVYKHQWGGEVREGPPTLGAEITSRVRYIWPEAPNVFLLRTGLL